MTNNTLPSWLIDVIQQRIDEENYTVNDSFESALEWVLTVEAPEPVQFPTTHGNRLSLSDYETDQYNAFQQSHCGTIEVIITFTGIGSTVELRCKGCGKSVDITDYDSW